MTNKLPHAAKEELDRMRKDAILKFESFFRRRFKKTLDLIGPYTVVFNDARQRCVVVFCVNGVEWNMTGGFYLGTELWDVTPPGWIDAVSLFDWAPPKSGLFGWFGSLDFGVALIRVIGAFLDGVLQEDTGKQ